MPNLAEGLQRIRAAILPPVAPPEKPHVEKVEQEKMPNPHLMVVPETPKIWTEQYSPTTATALAHIIPTARDEGFKYLTFYIPPNLSEIPAENPYEGLGIVFDRLTQTFTDNNARSRFVGDLNTAPRDFRIKVNRLRTQTEYNDGITVVFPVNYDGRKDIKLTAALLKQLGKKPEEIDEEIIEKYMTVSNVPDVDLVLYTGLTVYRNADPKTDKSDLTDENEEAKLASTTPLIHLLTYPWHSAYAEFAVTTDGFYQLTEASMKHIINNQFTARERRFGGLNGPHEYTK